VSSGVVDILTLVRICLLTHRDPSVVADDLPTVLAAAARHGMQVVTHDGEVAKHPGLAAFVDAGAVGQPWESVARGADFVLVLAGDGTLLRVLNALPDGPPVLGVNYGMLGYLSGIGHRELDGAITAIAHGEYRTVEFPLLEGHIAGMPGFTAGNDIVASGGVTGRIIEVAWRIVSHAGESDEQVDTMGIVPCDGMVIATPVGSTAYNLSNGGPVLAWGVRGFVVSFIAPHTLAARPMVVAPGDLVELEHLGRGAELQLFADGSQVGVLEPGQRLRVGYGTAQSRLAMVDTKSFYARYRDSFAAEAHEEHVRRPRTLPASPVVPEVQP
jgi:NAD+ kinase